jgi:hypothetical protein
MPTLPQKTRNPMSRLTPVDAFGRVMQRRQTETDRLREWIQAFNEAEAAKDAAIRERVADDDRALFDALVAQLPEIEKQAREAAERMMRGKAAAE